METFKNLDELEDRIDWFSERLHEAFNDPKYD